MRVLVPIMACALVCACFADQALGTVGEEGPRILVRNSRPDTVGAVYMTNCSDSVGSKTNVLTPREMILPDAQRVLEPQFPCTDIAFEVKGAVADSRSHISLSRGDTLLIVLRK
jgi:hypothetical protein